VKNAIIGTDKDGKIRVMNRAAEVMTGWPNEAAAGHALAEVFRIDSTRTEQPALENLLLARDRRPVPIEGGARGIRDAQGGLVEIRLQFSIRCPGDSEPLDAA